MIMTDGKVRPWGKLELALAYTDGTMSDRAALNWLSYELDCNPGLMDELVRLGYKRRNKRFTIAQIRVIFSTIGPP